MNPELLSVAGGRLFGAAPLFGMFPFPSSPTILVLLWWGVLIAWLVCIILWVREVFVYCQICRQRDQCYRQPEKSPSHPDNATGGNLGKLGSSDQNLSLSVRDADIGSNGSIGSVPSKRLSMLLNKALKFFGITHVKRVVSPNDRTERRGRLPDSRTAADVARPRSLQ